MPFPIFKGCEAYFLFSEASALSGSEVTSMLLEETYLVRHLAFRSALCDGAGGSRI